MLASGVQAVDGVELDGEAAARAAQDYRRVWVGNIETLTLPIECKYDRIICADVLEHTRDPTAIVHRLRAHLMPEGLLVVSVPNVAHWSLRVKLLLGRWEYTDRGLLDRTHYHFFTLHSIQKELVSAGYQVQEVAISPLIHAVIRPSGRLTRRIARLWPAGFGFQFVVTAKPV